MIVTGIILYLMAGFIITKLAIRPLPIKIDNVDKLMVLVFWLPLWLKGVANAILEKI